jgi:hypothetical protein
MEQEASMARPNAEDRRAQAAIAVELGSSGFALPGTILVRHICCKKPGCRCCADPPQLHGPYYQWTRRVDGKTQTRLLTAEQMERYRGWFDNARRLRALTSELEALSLDIAESAEGWS